MSRRKAAEPQAMDTLRVGQRVTTAAGRRGLIERLNGGQAFVRLGHLDADWIARDTLTEGWQ